MTLPLSDLGRQRRRCCLAGLLSGTVTASAQGAGRTLTVGPGERWRTLGAALRSAGDGDDIRLLAGDYGGDVAVVEQSHLSIRGLGSGARLLAEGRHAEGKAILVVRGDDVIVENLEFRGARVPSGNGAGIRFERGRLELRRCRFFDNEMGLLSANDPAMELLIEDCEFADAPRHEGLLHHLLYVGAIGSFTLRGSRLAQGWRGHLLKSRARRNRVEYNRLDDLPHGEASYELEFPNGGHNVVIGNVVAQSALTQNPALLSIGAEAAGAADGSLLLAHNTFFNAGGEDARFVHLWHERLPADLPVLMANNLFVGPGQLQLPPAHDGGGNRRIDAAALRDALRGDFRLLPASPLLGTAQAQPAQRTPQAEFVAPSGTRPLPRGRPLSPGALQLAD